MTISKLDRIEQIEKELALLKAEVKQEEKKVPVMRLGTNNYDGLTIGHTKSGFTTIGKIGPSGDMHMLSSSGRVGAFEEFIEDGGVYSSEEVEWRGGKYTLIGGMLRRLDIDQGAIYNFDECRPAAGCNDSNIKRHKSTNTPIAY